MSLMLPSLPDLPLVPNDIIPPMSDGVASPTASSAGGSNTGGAGYVPVSFMGIDLLRILFIVGGLAMVLIGLMQLTHTTQTVINVAGKAALA